MSDSNEGFLPVSVSIVDLIFPGFEYEVDSGVQNVHLWKFPVSQDLQIISSSKAHAEKIGNFWHFPDRDCICIYCRVENVDNQKIGHGATLDMCVDQIDHHNIGSRHDFDQDTSSVRMITAFVVKSRPVTLKR